MTIPKLLRAVAIITCTLFTATTIANAAPDIGGRNVLIADTASDISPMPLSTALGLGQHKDPIQQNDTHPIATAIEREDRERQSSTEQNDTMYDIVTLLKMRQDKGHDPNGEVRKLMRDFIKSSNAPEKIADFMEAASKNGNMNDMIVLTFFKDQYVYDTRNEVMKLSLDSKLVEITKFKYAPYPELVELVTGRIEYLRKEVVFEGRSGGGNAFDQLVKAMNNRSLAPEYRIASIKELELSGTQYAYDVLELGYMQAGEFYETKEESEEVYAALRDTVKRIKNIHGVPGEKGPTRGPEKDRLFSFVPFIGIGVLAFVMSSENVTAMVAITLTSLILYLVFRISQKHNARKMAENVSAVAEVKPDVNEHATPPVSDEVQDWSTKLEENAHNLTVLLSGLRKGKKEGFAAVGQRAEELFVNTYMSGPQADERITRYFKRTLDSYMKAYAKADEKRKRKAEDDLELIAGIND
ncbi:MAG: hypothetical protein JW938_04990, partial [Candidatus Omnitrophica bacterium]|nr:hypothetical protein [Candidatus Omnitrophota bacterium]